MTEIKSDVRVDISIDNSSEVRLHAVVIATTGRSSIVGETILSIADQQRPPDLLVLVACSTADVPESAETLLVDVPVIVVISERGLTRQRNAGIAACPPETDLITFLDDDVQLAADYLAQARRFANLRAEVALFSGEMIRDGATVGEISRTTAIAILESAAAPPASVTTSRSAYGCNMNVRAAIARDLRFDERLPLYGWLEDRDFSIRCAQVGLVGYYSGCRLVHLAAASGRSGGRRLGFAQIVNPYYLHRKGILTFQEVAVSWIRAFLGNARGAVLSSRAQMRIDRLAGNWVGLKEVVKRGRPEAILDVAD